MNRLPEPEHMDDPVEAAAYAAADFSDVNALFVARLLDLTESIERCDVIDLGTGPGDTAIRVARARPMWRMIGIDASEAILAFAREQAKQIPNLSFRRRDVKATGLPAQSVDVIFSNSLLHHMPDPLPMWREIVRIARPGALLFLRDLLRPASLDAAREIVQTYAGGESPLLQEEFYRSLLSAFSIDEIRAQIAAVAGLGSLQVEQVTDRHVDIFGVLPAL
jgi:ubiquinone/menaquinone biosynthesis C-methylase UbiE